MTIRDREFGAVRLRAFGVYSYRLADTRTVFQKLSGTRDAYTMADVEGQLRSTLVTALSQHLGESQVPFLDLAANLVALSAAVADRARALALESFQIQSASLPEELQKRLDERIGMGMAGDLGRYTQFQVAQSIPTAAAAEAGAAGAGVGLGAGIAMGQAMAQAVGQAGAPGGAPAAPRACPRCQARIERPGRFCPECGAALG